MIHAGLYKLLTKLLCIRNDKRKNRKVHYLNLILFMLEWVASPYERGRKFWLIRNSNHLGRGAREKNEIIFW